MLTYALTRRTVVHTIIAMNDDMKAKCEKTFYSELYHFEETSQGLLIDETTGQIYLKKTLDTYDKNVYGWLKANRNVHIPTIHSFWEEGGKLIVLEEYIQGDTLDSLLSKGIMNEPEKIRIVLNVCDALSFLHSAKIPIIHRDIKPSNIMITNDRIVKLIDYDAAKVFHRGKKEDTTLIGTVGRAAPEQYGFAQSDARTDVYSMGMMLKDMFPNDSRFTSIIARATAMSPSDRYQTMAQFKAAVESAVSKQGKKRNKTGLFIVAAAVILILSVGMFLAGRQSMKRTGSQVKAEEPVQLPEADDTVENTTSEITPDDNIEEDPDETVIQDETEDVEIADESEPSAENNDLVVEDSCWFVKGSGSNVFVHYGVVLKNRNDKKSIAFPVARITAKDKSGRILGTDDMTGGYIRPGDHVALSSLMSIAEVDSLDDVNVEISAASGRLVSDSDKPESTDFKIDKISDNKDELFPNVTGEITSSYKETVSVALTALFRKKGKLVATDTEYMDDIIPNTPTAFQIDLITGVPAYDSVEVMVQEW